MQDLTHLGVVYEALAVEWFDAGHGPVVPEVLGKVRLVKVFKEFDSLLFLSVVEHR